VERVCTRQDVLEAFKRRDLGFVPVGSFEQHGDYLPLITDTVIAAAISRELANAYPLLQLPPVTISCSHENSAWPNGLAFGGLADVGQYGDQVKRDAHSDVRHI